MSYRLWQKCLMRFHTFSFFTTTSYCGIISSHQQREGAEPWAQRCWDPGCLQHREHAGAGGHTSCFLSQSSTMVSLIGWRVVVIVQSLSCVLLFASSWTDAHQASLSFTISRSLLKLMSIESVLPSNHLIFSHPLLLLPSLFPSIRVFPNELALHIRWLKCWSFSFSISLSNE